MGHTAFNHKSVNIAKLISFGFNENNGIYYYNTEILEGQFLMSIEITVKSEVSTKLIDAVTDEPYTLHLVESASGAFVGSVRSEYDRILNEIAEKCFKKDVFKSEQAHKVINYISKTYYDELEFLWEKFSSNAVWRRKDNKKWYGVLLVLSKRKLGLNSDEVVDIIDLRAEPETIENIVDGEKYFSGYHMNKKHWLTIILDGSLPIQEIFDFIDKSYLLAKK